MIYPTLTQTTTSMTSSAVSPAAVVGEAAAVSQLFDDHTQVHHGVTLNQLTIGIAGMACLVVYLVRLPARLLSTASHTGATAVAPAVDTSTSSSGHGHASANGHASVNAAANGSPNQATGDSGSIVEKEKLINGIETKVDLNTSSVSVVWV